MSNKYTKVQLPSNIQDFTILRRVLDNIIQNQDRLYGNRGGKELATTDDVIKTFNSLGELKDNLNEVLGGVSLLDGSKPYTKQVGYSSIVSVSDDLSFITLKTLKSKAVTLPSATTKIIGIDSDTDVLTELQTTVNDLLVALKSSLMFN